MRRSLRASERVWRWLKAMVEGNRENIKLTTPFDLKIANELITHPLAP